MKRHRCPKCGNTWVTVLYDHLTDRLSCRCECSYHWYEETEDKKPAVLREPKEDA